jgi:hypothetical protein
MRDDSKINMKVNDYMNEFIKKQKINKPKKSTIPNWD